MSYIETCLDFYVALVLATIGVPFHLDSFTSVRTMELTIASLSCHYCLIHVLVIYDLKRDTQTMGCPKKHPPSHHAMLFLLFL